MAADSGNEPHGPFFTAEQRWRFKEYGRRLAYVGESYRYWKSVEKDRPTINESLDLLRRQLQVPNRKRRDPVRLHPMVEIGISIIALRGQPGTSLATDCSRVEIEEASRELLRRTKPIRGRPANPTLVYHVKALVLAGEWATGIPVTASTTKNSVYDPQMTSDGASAIEIAFIRIDPSVTRTAFVDIIRKIRAGRELEGKRFEDFFPLYRPAPHPEHGPLARAAIDVAIAHPIYVT